MDGGDYYYFNERRDVLSSLELLRLVLPHVRDNSLLWKWVIIGAHAALQGALVCALLDTSGTSVMTDKAAKKVLAWHDAKAEERGPYPDDRLAEFETLLERCLSTQVVNATPEVIKNVRLLHTEFRSQFSHFRPVGWAIRKATFPPFVKAAVDMVSDLMSRDNVTMHLEEQETGRLAVALAEISAQLEQLR